MCKFRPIQVASEDTRVEGNTIRTHYSYYSTKVYNGLNQVVPTKETVHLSLNTDVKRTGVLLVGLGGNNGSTFYAGVEANRRNLQWRTRRGLQSANWLGSWTQSGTMLLGEDELGADVFVSHKEVVPLTDPSEFVVGGWDICADNLLEAVRKAFVLEPNMIDQLTSQLEAMKPMKGVYRKKWIAANQEDRATWFKTGSLQSCLEELRGEISAFRRTNELEKVIVLWTANTESLCDWEVGVHDTAEALLTAISNDDERIPPSMLYATACALEGVPFINGAPQNTICPGIVELASTNSTFVAGDDFKTGQTKLKSVLTDFLISAGFKLSSIVSYNHLGNNDGRNLSSAAQFKSKEVSKSNVVKDMISSNPMMYPNGEEPDHTVVIKYVPSVGDSKRAMDEYSSEIFCGGVNTIAMHNTCEDSLLAVPLMADLIVIAEFCTRVRLGETAEDMRPMNTVLSLLSLLTKAPLVPKGQPVINSFFSQRDALQNFFRALVGLPPANHMRLLSRFV